MNNTPRVLLFITTFILMASFVQPFVQPVHAVACVSNGTGGGNWYDGATWSAGCGAFGPVTGDSAQISAGDTVTFNGDLTGHSLTGITVDVGGILATGGTSRNLNSNSITVNGTFRIDEGGFAHSGTFTYGASGILNFANTSGEFGLANSHVFWPSSNGPANLVVGSGGVNMNTTSRTISNFVQVSGPLREAHRITIDSGTMQLDGGYSFPTTGPIFSNGVKIHYNSGGFPTVGAEWTNDPDDVQLSNSTSLSFGAGSIARNMTGDLTIDSGASLYMGDGTNNNFTVAGNVTLDGHLGLPFNGAGNIEVGGNWDKGGSGSFTHNDSIVIFNGGTNQTISGAMSNANRFRHIQVINNSDVIFDNNVGIETSLEVASGSSFGPNTTENFEQELSEDGILDCDGSCTFDRLTIRDIDASDSTGTIDINENFVINNSTSEFTAPPTMSIAGDFDNNANSGSVNFSDSTVTFDGATTQMIEGDGINNFVNVTVTNSTMLVDNGDNAATASGTITNNGTIRRTETVTGATTGNINFGLPGVTMNVNSTDAGDIQVDRIAGAPPNPAAGLVGNSEHYDVTHSGSAYSIDFTFLNFSGETNGLRSCRFINPGWNCELDDNSGDTSTLTRDNVTAFSNWGSCGNCGPTSIQLQLLTGNALNLPLAAIVIGLGLLTVLTVFVIRSRLRKVGIKAYK